jgi:hypothetical protein
MPVGTGCEWIMLDSRSWPPELGLLRSQMRGTITRWRSTRMIVLAAMVAAIYATTQIMCGPGVGGHRRDWRDRRRGGSCLGP